MGYRCRWMAMRGRDRADVLARLDFGVTDELTDEIYDPGLYAFEVEGWLVIFGDGWDFMDLVTRRAASKLSNKGEVLYLYTDDTPMKAELTSFVDGQVRWSITYDGEDGPSRVAAQGTLPAQAKPIIAAANQAQKGVRDVDHVYDVVAELALTLVGFRHDQTPSSGKYLPAYALMASS
jgi:hypothetical protein